MWSRAFIDDNNGWTGSPERASPSNILVPSSLGVIAKDPWNVKSWQLLCSLLELASYHEEQKSRAMSVLDYTSWYKAALLSSFMNGHGYPLHRQSGLTLPVAQSSGLSQK